MLVVLYLYILRNHVKYAFVFSIPAIILRLRQNNEAEKKFTREINELLRNNSKIKTLFR